LCKISLNWFVWIIERTKRRRNLKRGIWLSLFWVKIWWKLRFKLLSTGCITIIIIMVKIKIYTLCRTSLSQLPRRLRLQIDWIWSTMLRSCTRLRSIRARSTPKVSSNNRKTVIHFNYIGNFFSEKDKDKDSSEGVKSVGLDDN